MATAKMSDTGAVILPKAVRDAHGLKPGAEFEVIDGGSDITLRLVDTVPDGSKKLSVEEFLAKSIPYAGPEITDEIINEAILEEANRRWYDKNSR